MNVQAPITQAVRIRFELPQALPSELQAWPPELPRAEVELRPPQRQRQRKAPAGTIPSLSARARWILTRRLSSRGRRLAEAAPCERRLLRTAVRYSRADLLAERGVGHTVVDEIEAWLTAHGKQFRDGPASLETALALALGHIEAMLDGADEGAFLAAFVALPALRRSLTGGLGRRPHTHLAEP